MAGYRVAVMKIGLFAINYGACADPELAVRVARHAEAAGFESVWTGEHVVLPDPAPPGFAIPPTLPLLDTVVGLTLVAAHTSTVKVASGIIVLPLRNPVILAKELASVDVVSNGRLIAGFAAGYVSAEFTAAGVPMAGRGARMEDYIRAMRALWSMDRPDYQGQFVSFSGIDARPRPRQRPAPPVVIGGEAPAALRRAVTMAEGWYGFYLDVRETRRYVGALRQLAQEYERPAGLGRLELTVTPAGPLDAAAVERYAELGVDRLVLLPQPDASPSQRHDPVPVDRILRNIDVVAERIIAP
jgi:probable F420-dependent oxidoreductase